MMYSATGSNLGDIECQNIVFYEYGIRVIGIVEHTDNSYSSTAIQTKLYWGNTTIKSKSADGIFFLDLSDSGNIQNLNVVSQRGNNKCKNPDIVDTVHTDQNSTYIQMKIKGLYSFSGSSSYQNRCQWSADGNHSTNSYKITAFSSQEYQVVWRLDSNGYPNQWIVILGYQGQGTGLNSNYGMFSTPEKDSVILLGAAEIYEDIICAQSNPGSGIPWSTCNLHEGANSTTTFIPAKTSADSHISLPFFQQEMYRVHHQRFMMAILTTEMKV